MSSTFATNIDSQSVLRTSRSQSIVFIDSDLDDYQTLAGGVLPGAEIIILDKNGNGVEQITAKLQTIAAAGGNVDQVHIFSHGNSGSLQLGSATLNSDNLPQYESQLQEWRNALSDKADIVLYGCDVAGGSGSNFVDRLGELTGADIAASSDRTGRGGNWNLEFAKGDIEAPLALTPEAMADYRGTLATLTVTNTNDSGPGSLRSAIASAAAGDTIQFASTLASQTITLTSGQLVINKNLTIDASGATNLTISGNNSSRVILTEGSTNVTLKNLIVANGKVSGTDPNNEATSSGGGIQTGGNSTLTLDNCQVNNNVAGFGGGIYTGFKSTTNVTNSTFDGNDGRSANSERGGGAIATKSGGSLTVKGSTFTNNKGINGGAINHLLGNLTVENSTFLNNDSTAGAAGAHTSGYGGAIYTDGANASGTNSTPGPVGGTIAIRNSRFEGNKGAGQGGGMFLFVYPPDKIIVEGSTIVNNQVVKSSNGDALGGGLRIGNGEFTISNTTFSNNLAPSQGGALWVGEKSPGTIINSTFAGNKAEDASGTSGLGGAIMFNTSESISIVNSTIAKNSAGFQGGAFWGGGSQITLKNTIVANNTANNGGNSWKIKQNAGSSKFSDGGGNFQWPAKNPNDSSDFNVTDAVTIADPKLDVLQTINGFSVMPLLAGSPAIDKGIAAGAPATDQRGVSRPQDGDGNGSAIVDIGAFEFTTLTLTASATPAPTLTGSLGQTNNYSSVTDLIAQWPNAAQNQGIKLSGIAFDGVETGYLNPNVISNLTLATNENPKSWLSYGSTGGIGVPSSYDGWFTDVKKNRAEINHNPNTNQSQALKVKWADNQDITSTTIDLTGLSPKTSPDLGDQGNEVAFLQIFNNGVLVPATNFKIARLNAPSAPKPISVSSDGVTFIGDRTDGSFKFQIVGNSSGGATFDELRFSTKAYDSPTAAYVATSFKNDGSDYLVQKIEYQGISNVTPTPTAAPSDSLTGSIDTAAVPPTSFYYGSPPDPIIDGGSGQFTINRTGNTSVSASVNYLIVAPGSGQPANNVDYNISPFSVNPSSGTVNFNPGQTSVSLTINNLPGLTGGVVNLGFGPGSISTPASTAITLL